MRRKHNRGFDKRRHLLTREERSRGGKRAWMLYRSGFLFA